MLIPLFGDTGGAGLSKSNFWFSLLYLNILINELDFPIKDVVMVGLNESPYFKNLIKEPVSFNILICDDGSYSGNQILMNVLPRIFQFDIMVINKLYSFLFPFCSKICQEKYEYFKIRDKVKDQIIKKNFLHMLRWKSYYRFAYIAPKEKQFIKNQLLKDMNFSDLFIFQMM